MNTFKKPGIPFTVSSIFFLLISLLSLFYLYLLPLQKEGEFGFSCPPHTLLSIALTFLLAIFLIVRNWFVGNSVILGLLTGLKVYSILEEHSFFRMQTPDEIFANVAVDLLPLITMLLIFLISLGAIFRPLHSLGKIWFLPIIFTFVLFPLYVINYIMHFGTVFSYSSYTNFGYNMTCTAAEFLTYILSCIAITLLCKWYGRVIRDKREYLKNNL